MAFNDTTFALEVQSSYGFHILYRSEKLLIQRIPMIKEEKVRQVAIEARRIVRKYISSK